MPRKAMNGLQKVKNTLKGYAKFYEYVLLGIFLGGNYCFHHILKGVDESSEVKNQCFKQKSLYYFFSLLI